MKEIGKTLNLKKGFSETRLKRKAGGRLPEMIARADRYGITAEIVTQARERYAIIFSNC